MTFSSVSFTYQIKNISIINFDEDISIFIFVKNISVGFYSTKKPNQSSKVLPDTYLKLPYILK